MKALYIVAAAVALMLAPLTSRADDDFPYPAVPEAITDFTLRADYFVSHFWERAHLDKGISKRDRFAQAFDQWIQPMTMAHADTVNASIKTMMRQLDKRPDDQLWVANLAEDRFYGDSATMLSDELYRAFVLPMLRNSRVDKALKARHEQQFKVLGNSMVGHTTPPISYQGRDASPHIFAPIEGRVTVLYLFDPDCNDCFLARVRLAADWRLNDLIAIEGKGGLDLTALSVGKPDADWQMAAMAMPKTWHVGAVPDLDMLIDMREGTPAFWIYGTDGRLAAKNLSVDELLSVIASIPAIPPTTPDAAEE